MHDDFRLATGLLSGVKKAQRAFDQRFRDAADRALEHCRVAVGLGLTLGDYVAGVAASAARSLLSSLPATRKDAALDPHVTRVLGHRDFALALLLQQGSSEAWSAFVERFGDYLRSLLLRLGRTPGDAERLMRRLLDELRTPSTLDDRLPIEDYSGRCDLNLWLFTYVRRRLAAEAPDAVEEMRPARPRLAAAATGDDHEDAHRLVEEVWRELRNELAPADARLLDVVASGGTLRALAASGILADRGRAPSPAGLLQRHHDVVERLYQGLRERVVRRSGLDASAADRLVQDTLIADLARDLAPICGSAIA